MISIPSDTIGPKWDSDKLYGRGKELEVLNSLAAERSSGCVLVHGNEGTGKSSLMEVIPWEQNYWVFVTGRYEQRLSSEPYSALVCTLDKLVELWAINNSQSENSQMGDFCELIDQDIELLQVVIPRIIEKVEKITNGKYVPKNKSISDSQRSHHDPSIPYVSADSVAVAASFLRIFSFLSSATPVALFFDDFHHADAASSDIIELLAYAAAFNGTASKNRMLLVLSYRCEEIENNKFAHKTIRSIREFESKSVYNLHLEDLNIDSLNGLVASMLNCSLEYALPLSMVIHKKTAGNPFFVSKFLRFARERGFFTFSTATCKWEWGDVRVLDQYASVSDNVADMLALTMDKLSVSSQVVLKVSSCLGNIIPRHVLVEHFRSFDENGDGHISCPAVIGVETGDLDHLLDNAVEAGILVKSRIRGAYRWSNERLQHVAYSFIPTAMRAELHMKIGRLLWRLGIEDDEEWMIFMAASQMNKYTELQCDSSLGNEVAELNLHAAKLSLKKAALFPALEMLVHAEKHLDTVGRWENSYDLTLDILTNLCETQMEVGCLDQAVEVGRNIVQNAKSLDDSFRAHLVLLNGLVSGQERNFDLGIEKTLELLKLYGEKNPKKMFPGQKCVEKKKLKKLLPGGELEGLLELPDMVDEKALKVQILLMNHLTVYAYSSAENKSLGWFASVRALKASCKYGISPVTNMAVIQMATKLRIEGHLREASEYAEFALLLSERIPRKLGSNHGMVRSAAVGALRSFNNCLNELFESRADCLRSGLPKDAVLVSMAYATAYMCVGLPLASLDSDLISFVEDAKHFGSPYTIQQTFLFFRQAIANLQNKVDNPTLLSGNVMDQAEELKKVEGHGRAMSLRDINMHRLMLCCVFGDWCTAEVVMDDLEKYLDTPDAFNMRFHFRRCYMGLAAFGLSREARSTKKRKKYRTIGKKILQSFASDMKDGSVNAFPIVRMLEAEESPSKENYDKAIRACARLGLVHHEAYMCERAGLYFNSRMDERWSEFYLAQAVLLYGEWGATGKAERLTDEHSLHDSCIQESSNNSSLLGRSRYSSKELDALREINWDSFMVKADSMRDGEKQLQITELKADSMRGGSRKNNSR
eukprot:scaffold747_cov120-Cylindrotheca_fusiformis.AAC.9